MLTRMMADRLAIQAVGILIIVPGADALSGILPAAGAVALTVAAASGVLAVAMGLRVARGGSRFIEKLYRDVNEPAPENATDRFLDRMPGGPGGRLMALVFLLAAYLLAQLLMPYYDETIVAGGIFAWTLVTVIGTMLLPSFFFSRRG